MLHVVHCVDTEGPLWEPLEETFLRLNKMFGIDVVPSEENLKRLQCGQLDLGSPEISNAVKLAFSSQQLGFLISWDEINRMLDRIDDEAFRSVAPDSAGNPWHINWHCVAHYGFDPNKNPRRRALGLHSIFDHYNGRYRNKTSNSIHWHYHPIPISAQANHCATSYFRNPAIFEIISRRILERNWFPCVNRPGFHAERPDSNWFLEQWMPFDIANLNSEDDTFQPDLQNGRWGDWRRAPKGWSIYHPSHDDYQTPGECRRAIARCLMLEGRIAPLTPAEIEKAFIQARDKPTILAFANHDYRDMQHGISFVQKELAKCSELYRDVKWYYSDAATAMRSCLGIKDAGHCKFEYETQPLKTSSHRLNVSIDRQIFGPQPWLCFALKDGRVFHDNFDFGLKRNSWHYTFDDQTVILSDVACIGIAANTAAGKTSVVTFETEANKETRNFLN